MKSEKRNEFEHQLSELAPQRAPEDLRDVILNKVPDASDNNSGSLLDGLRWLWQVPRAVQVSIAAVWMLGLGL